MIMIFYVVLLYIRSIAVTKDAISTTCLFLLQEKYAVM